MRQILIRSLTAILIFIAISAVFFWPYLEGKRIYQSDIVQYLGMTQEISKFEAEIGRKPLWTNAMFGGMPAFQISTPHKGNYLSELNQIWQLGRENPVGLLFIGMSSFYLLLLILRVDYRLAIIGGVVFGLATNNLILYEAGHISKLRALSYLPLLTSGLVLGYRGRYWWGFFLFSIGFGLNLLANHVQMTYYFFLTLPLFMGVVLFKAIRDKAVKNFMKASGILLAGLVLALGSAVSSLWSTYEYSTETIRGNSILSPPGDELVDSTVLVSQSNGLDWQNAMQWSNGMIDILACVIPGAAGGSSNAMLFEESALYQELASQGVNQPGTIRAPLYWGPLPFTNGPFYMGMGVFFFFILGLFIVKGPLKWWLGAGTVLLVLLSMGKNISIFNEFVFNNVPLYNKFRAPNSVLSLLSFMTSLLGFLAMHKILTHEQRHSFWSLIKKTGFRLLGLSLALAFLGPYLFSFSSPLDPHYEAQGLNIDMLIHDRKYLFRLDCLRGFLLIGILLLVLWSFIRGRINLIAAILGIGFLIIADFWTIGRRFIDYDSFQEAKKYERTFEPREVDLQIMNDPDPNFRVLDWTANPFNTSATSYFHKSLGGYHAAKLRRYQDVIDRYLIRGDRGVINMLNTKYMIQTGDDGRPAVWNNQEALGNAWSVDSILFVEDANQELDALDQINPANTAIVHKEYRGYLKDLDSDDSGSVDLMRYIPDHLTYSTNSAREMLAVFSEIWYGPDKGWEVFIDGKPVNHIRVNYLLRGLRIPAGEHTIEFIFKPRSFYTGRIVSRISSSLILYGFIWFLGMTYFMQSGFDKIKSSKTSIEPDLLLDTGKDNHRKAKSLTKKTALSANGESVAPVPEKSVIPDFRIFPDHRFLPRVFKILAALVLVIMMLMSLSSGINADDEYQVDYSKKLVNFYTSFGKDTSALYVEDGNMHLYGGFFDLTTGMVNHLLGLDEHDARYHQIRHLFIALMGFLGIWFSSLLAKEMGGWRAGILTLLLMFLSPRYLGHSLMNPKDIPFAAGYMMAVYFMVRFYSNFPGLRWIDAIGIILGIGLSLGTRAGGLLLIVFFLAFGGIDFIRKNQFNKWSLPSIWYYLKYLLIISLGAYFFAILFWPGAFNNPLTHPLQSLNRFEDLNVYIRLLFKGENVMSDQVSGDYILVWIWRTVPVFCLFGFLGSIAFYNSSMKRYSPFTLVILYMVTVFPVLYIILKDAVLHDGWRHVIFIYPTLIILSVLCWIGLEHKFRDRKVILYSIYGFLFLTCLESGRFIASNHSFPYVYFNAFGGGLEKAHGNFETDYWGVSVRQAIEWMEEQRILDKEMKDTIVIATSFYYNVSRQLDISYRNKVRVVYLRYRERYDEAWDYAIYPSRFIPGIQIRSGSWPPAETLHTITADNIPLVAILRNSQEVINQGMKALKSQDWEMAIELLQQGLMRYPDNVEVMRGLATAKMNSGEYQEAIDLNLRSLEIGGPDAMTYADIGMIYQMIPDMEKAKQAFFQAIGINRDFYHGYYQLAMIYQEEGNLTAAKENALKVIDGDPGFVEAHRVMAELYEEQGDSEKAAHFRNEYLRLSAINR
jgi:tetratricopeptide (TPR) repeat protein